MITFTRYENTSLYSETGSPNEEGYLAFYLSVVPAEPPATITLDESWDNYIGFYLILQTAPANEASLAVAAEAYFTANYPNPEHTGFAWAAYDDANPEELGVVTAVTAKTEGNDPVQVVIAEDMAFTFRNYRFPYYAGAPIVTTTGNDNTIDGFTFEYPPWPGAPSPIQDRNTQLPFTGDLRFTLQGQLSLSDLSDTESSGWNASLNYVINDEGTDVGQNYPLFTVPADTQVLFDFVLDPVAPLNEIRCYLAFVGNAFVIVQEGAVYQLEAAANQHLDTFWRTVYGEEVSLMPVSDSERPARLLFENLFVEAGAEPLYYLSPDGDFEFYVPGAEEQESVESHPLLAGLSGAESFRFTPRSKSASGDVLRFEARQGAYAPVFPVISEAETATPNKRALRKINPGHTWYHTGTSIGNIDLNDQYRTSWVNIRPYVASNENVPVYYSQPDNAALYDNQSVTENVMDQLLMLRETPAAYFPEQITTTVPMVPYAGVTDDGLSYDDLRSFEKQILNPQRRALIAAMPEEAQLEGREFFEATVQTTTPQGLIATVPESGLNWESVLLAKSESKDITYELGWSNGLTSEVRNALQSNQLFLVVTSPANMGTFNNGITIADWPFTINIGTQSENYDYSNILIFKFCTGSVEDRIADTQTWNSPDEFNEDAELVSVWLRNYIYNTKINAGSDDAYANFVNIIQDPNWNGILALNTDVSVQNFPDDLKGLLAGINRDEFYAHHIGIEINYVEAQGNTLTLPKSSLFGLIDYVDRSEGSNSDIGAKLKRGSSSWTTPYLDSLFDEGNTAGLYDFTVASLQVIFENSAIKNFTSQVELTTTAWFGETATLDVDNYGDSLQQQTLVFNGSYESHNGTNTYTFVTDSSQVYKFNMASQVFSYIEISKAQFNTLTANADKTGAAGETTEVVNSQFSFWGYLNFLEIDSFDMFSFGNEADDYSENRGLYFSGLTLDMSFLLNDDTGETGETSWTFNPDDMAFDIALSTPRTESLFSKFPITLSGLTWSGDNNSTLADLGYMSMVLKSPVTIERKALEEVWYGLVFDQNLGSMGALAADAGFTAKLILAWSPDANSLRLDTGINLPGVGGGQKTLSLQTVLNVGIDSVTFESAYVDEVAADELSYLLKLNNVKLRIIGKKLPDAASTQIILFGDSAGKDKTTLGWYAAYYLKQNG